LFTSQLEISLLNDAAPLKYHAEEITAFLFTSRLEISL
jgi:hypothetical protein